MTVDRDAMALSLAINTQRAKDKDSAEQIDAMLAQGDSRVEVGRFCAYSCQCDSLRLAPHQYPPCWIDDDYDPATEDDPGLRRVEAWRLLQKMLFLGISKYHPDPLAAIKEARR